MPDNLFALAGHVADARASLARALTASSRLAGHLPDETVLRVRIALTVAQTAVGLSTAPLAGAMSEAQQALASEEPPPW